MVPTVLASLWAVLRHPSSWSEAVSTAIHLGGDVDTLGAIVGALMGAHLGLSAIPAHLADAVLDPDDIRRLAHRYFLAAVGRQGEFRPLIPSGGPGAASPTDP